MIRQLFPLFLAFFFSTNGPAQKVLIEGKAPAYTGKEAELVTVKDHYTQMDTVLDKDRVSDEGNFRFELKSERIRPAWVRIGNARSKIYLEPGKTYEVDLPEIPEGKALRPYGWTDVQMTFYELPEQDANNLVIDFNRVYDHFFANNYRAMGLQYTQGGGYTRHRTDIVQERDSLAQERLEEAPSLTELVDSLEGLLEERYAGVEKAWFRVHYEHALAPLRETASQNRRAAYERYFAGKKVRYEHEEYMRHFLEFYNKHFLSFARRNDSLIDLEYALAHERDPEPLLKALEQGDYMGSRAIRELVLIDGLWDAFHYREKEFSKEGIHAVLDSLASGSPNEGARRIARNLSEFLSTRQKGFSAPPFRLMDRDTNIVALRDLRGKPTYINFWASWSQTSIKEMKLIADMHEAYGHNINFVSISTDEEFSDMKDFLEEHPDYDWNFLYLGEHDEVRKAYEVVSIPAFHLLDEEGHFLRIPAPKPSGEAKGLLHRISSRMDRRRKKRGGGYRDH